MKEHLEEKRNEKKPLESASVAKETSDNNEVGADLLLVSLGNNVLSESWVSDSTYSYHRTPKKDWFDTYKPYNGNMVQMGNDATCPVIEIGTVKIKMFDVVVRVLSNVKHVPNLRKNLISLGVLNDLGYSYSSKGGIMKITKGALMVMKGQKVRTLYKLIGNTVVRRVAITTLVESNTDDTKLWHMRLGHIGERGMLELHKRNLSKGMKTCKLDFCEYCVHGKQHKVSFKTGSHTSKLFLTTFIQMFGVQYQFLLIAVLSLSSISLITTLERYGFIL